MEYASIIRCYIELAIAIVESGIKVCDISFMKSEWYRYLCDNICEYLDVNKDIQQNTFAIIQRL